MAEKHFARVSVGQNCAAVSGPHCAGITMLVRDVRVTLQLGDPR